MMGKKKTAKMRGGGMAKKKTAKMRGGGMASGSREGSVINTPTAFEKGGRVKKTGPSRSVGSLAVAKKIIERLKKQIETMKPRSKFGGKKAGDAVRALLPRKSRPDMADIAGRKATGTKPRLFPRNLGNVSKHLRRPGRGLPSGTVIGKDGRPVPSLRASKGGRVK
jgi:hypothetical protein|tara:strand:+ start:442 stop:939 length:498 start_codon:yes stop_codon:yes gene_type:complete